VEHEQVTAGGLVMMRFAILAGCLVVAATPVFAQDKAIFQQMDDAWAAAYNKGDAKAVAAMYTADAYVLPDHAPMAHGRAGIAAMLKKLMAGSQNDLKITLVDVTPLGPGIVREITNYEITIKGQPPQHDVGKAVAVDRQVGGKWLIQTDIWNSNK
jgi:uncharacterized protein (TIGR02246 family)